MTVGDDVQEKDESFLVRFHPRNSAASLMRPDRYRLLLSLQKKKVEEKEPVESEEIAESDAPPSASLPVRYSLYLAEAEMSECQRVLAGWAASCF